jgi:hypothetical protein
LFPKPEFEAHRIAAELVRLHRDGGVASQKGASFYAHLLHDFGATYTGPVSNTDAEIRRARMCRLPCSASASLAGSPWKNGCAFCRRISTRWWLEGYKQGKDRMSDMIESASKIPEPVCECCGGPDPDYMDETLGLVCEGCSQMLGSAK